MKELLEPIKSESLVEIFIQKFESLILSGKLKIGQKLPPERELALQLGVSRPVVHEGLLHLDSRGLVKMIPRVGTFINDYRREGSLALLNSLVHYSRGAMDVEIFRSLLQVRYHIETETARLAAANHTAENMEEFRALLKKEETAGISDPAALAELDFSFHHLVSIAGGNVIYPMLLNSFRDVYINFTSIFFTDASIISGVFLRHSQLIEAIEGRNINKAVRIMKKIIQHGEEHLKAMI